MVIPTIQEIESKLQPDFGRGGHILKDDVFFRIFGIDMVLPRGMYSDGLSIPWVFTLFIRKNDPRYIFWAMVHDYIYHTQFMPRLIADGIMREGLIAQGYTIVPRLFYRPLRVFGLIAWKKNQKKGLKKFPEAKERLLKKQCYQYIKT